MDINNTYIESLNKHYYSASIKFVSGDAQSVLNKRKTFFVGNQEFDEGREKSIPGEIYMITIQQFKEVFPRCKNPEEWVKILGEVLPKYKINTSQRVAAFLAQCGHESAGWTVFEEDLYYSAKGLNLVFPKYFKDAGRDANEYARKPEKIANIVYANRMGNGPVSSGDGWNYHGRGPIQLTFKNNYKAFYKDFPDLPFNVVDHPDTVLTDLETSLKSAIWFWNKNNLNSYSDRGDIKGQTRVINGGYNGLKDRIHLFIKIKTLLSGTDVIINSSDTNAGDYNSLRLGSSGSGVKTIQSILGIKEDGNFGPKTEEAVQKYQKDHNLVPDGIVGPKTLDSMLDE